MLLIDLFLITISLVIGFSLSNVLALPIDRFDLFLQLFLIACVGPGLHALLSLAVYIHREVDESTRFLSNLMLICLTLTVLNLIKIYLQLHQ